MSVVRVFTVLLLFGILSEGVGHGICSSYDLSVTDVTSTSAVLHWKIGNKAQKRFRDHEVHCAGVRHYTKADGTPVTDTDKVVRFAPRRLNRHFLGNLLPNFKYSCIVTEEADKSSRSDVDTSSPLLFSTHYKAPEAPKAPLIHAGNADSDHEHHMQVDLFAASSKYGPISGYKVQFHLVDGSPSYIDGLPRILPEFLKPFGPLVPLDKAQKTSQPISFCVSYDTLPENITVGDDLLGGALKSGAVYSVVTVAYTRMGENFEKIFFSASRPSQPFTAEDHGSHHEAERVGGHRTSRNLAIILGVLLPLVIVIYISLVGAFLAHRELQMAKHKKSSRRKKRHSKKPSPSTGFTSVPHAFDIEHSHSHMGHHDHLERTEKGRPMGAPVLPRHPTAISPTSSLSLMHSTSSDTFSVDIDGLSEQDFPSLPQFTMSESISNAASVQSQVASSSTVPLKEDVQVPSIKTADSTEDVQRIVYNTAHELFWSRHFDSSSSSSSEDEDDPVNTGVGIQKMLMGRSICIFDRDQPSFNNARAYCRDEEHAVQIEEVTEESSLENLPAHLQEPMEGQSSSFSTEAQMDSKKLQGVNDDEESAGANLLRKEVEDERSSVSLDLEPAGESLQSQTSSHLFLPRGLSSGPYRTQSVRTQTSSHVFLPRGLSSGPYRTQSVRTQTSSHAFLPRGHSSGLYRTQSVRTRSNYALGLSSGSSHQLFSQRSYVRNLRAQLSIGSSLGYQTDQVPEMEMEWYHPDSA